MTKLFVLTMGTTPYTFEVDSWACFWVILLAFAWATRDVAANITYKVDK